MHHKKIIALVAVQLLVFENAFSQNVGIGITSPDEELQVDSVIRIGKNSTITNGINRRNVIKFGDGNFVYIAEQDKDDRLVLKATSFSFRDGNIGVGIDSATAAIDVSGQIRLRSGAGTAGHVLTSDALGYASWKAPVATLPGFLASAEPLTINSGAGNVKIPFTSEVGPAESLTNYDDFNTFNDISHSFVVPANGVYQYNVAIRLVAPSNATSTGNIGLRLFVNGSNSVHATLNTNRFFNFAAGQPVPQTISSSGIIPLIAGDLIEVYVSQNSGVALDVFNGPYSNFSMYRIR